MHEREPERIAFVRYAEEIFGGRDAADEEETEKERELDTVRKEIDFGDTAFDNNNENEQNNHLADIDNFEETRKHRKPTKQNISTFTDKQGEEKDAT